MGLGAYSQDVETFDLAKLKEHTEAVLANRAALATPIASTVKRYAADPKIQQRIYGNAIYQQISSSLAGSHEYAAMSKLYELAQRGEYDLLVLDTPPTENALDFLEAPDKVSRAIESEAIQWIMKPTAQAGSWGLRVLGMGSAFVLRGLAKFVGSRFLEQMAEFFVEFSQVFAGFRERSLKVQELLRRPEVAFVLVCSPEPMSIDEALYFHERLRRSQMSIGACVVNRVHSAGPALSSELLPLLRARPELAGYAADDLEKLAADLGRTYNEQQVLAATDEATIARLSATAKEPLRRVPMFEQDIHDASGIALLGMTLWVVWRHPDTVTGAPQAGGARLGSWLLSVYLVLVWLLNHFYYQNQKREIEYRRAKLAKKE